MGAALVGLLLAGSCEAAMLTPGTSMPEFALSDQTGAVVRSTDLAGKTYLLWFYPKAMTPGCTTEARSIRDNYAALQTAGVTVLGVSFDDPDSNRKFVEAESLPFRLLSDTDRKLAVALGAAESTSAWFARRISYLVGPDGKIRKAYDNVDPSNHAAQVLGDL
jgi:peroxiredoxin Q/BCP